MSSIKEFTSQVEDSLLAFEPSRKLAEIHYAAGMIPSCYGQKKSFRDPDIPKEMIIGRYTLALIQGGEMGIKPSQVGTALYYRDGKIMLFGSALTAKIKQDPNYKSMDLSWQGDYDKGNLTLTGKGETKNGETFEVVYSMKDADRAGHLGVVGANGKITKTNKRGSYQDTWCTSPKDMMTYKVLARLQRVLWPGATNGLSVKEDMDGVDLNEASVEPVPTQKTGGADDEKVMESFRNIEASVEAGIATGEEAKTLILETIRTHDISLPVKSRGIDLMNSLTKEGDVEEASTSIVEKSIKMIEKEFGPTEKTEEPKTEPEPEPEPEPETKKKKKTKTKPEPEPKVDAQEAETGTEEAPVDTKEPEVMVLNKPWGEWRQTALSSSKLKKYAPPAWMEELREMGSPSQKDADAMLNKLKDCVEKGELLESSVMAAEDQDEIKFLLMDESYADFRDAPYFVDLRKEATL